MTFYIHGKAQSKGFGVNASFQIICGWFKVMEVWNGKTLFLISLPTPRTLDILEPGHHSYGNKIKYTKNHFLLLQNWWVLSSVFTGSVFHSLFSPVPPIINYWWNASKLWQTHASQSSAIWLGSPGHWEDPAVSPLNSSYKYWATANIICVYS